MHHQERKTLDEASLLSSESKTQHDRSSNPQQLPPLLPKPTTKPLPPIKHMSPTEMQIRREKGLCFTCDEKYSWKHVCPNKHLMLFLFDLDGSELPSSKDSMAPPSLVAESDSTALLHHLSLQAYQGSPSCATIHFKGFIAGKSVQVLLDGGSSDSFIQSRLAHNLQLPMEPTADVKVMVGNEHYLHAEGVVRDLPLTISGQTIRFPAYVLPVSGVVVVLGAS